MLPADPGFGAAAWDTRVWAAGDGGTETEDRLAPFSCAASAGELARAGIGFAMLSLEGCVSGVAGVSFKAASSTAVGVWGPAPAKHCCLCFLVKREQKVLTDGIEGLFQTVDKSIKISA